MADQSLDLEPDNGRWWTFSGPFAALRGLLIFVPIGAVALFVFGVFFGLPDPLVRPTTIAFILSPALLTVCAILWVIDAIITYGD